MEHEPGGMSAPPISMRDAVRDFDWASTPLGPMADWPAALKIVADLILRSHFPKCICWGPEMTAIHNDAFLSILDKKGPMLGHSFRDIWAESWDDIGPIAERALRGESTFIKNFELESDRSGRREKGYFTFCYSPIPDETGAILGFMDTVIDTTGEVESDRRIRIVNGELRHRMKNAYMIAGSIVKQTLRRAESTDAAVEAISSRLQLLNIAQSALLDDTETSVDVATLVRQITGPYGSERVALRGGSFRLDPAQVFALTLAIGELATNAVKYGALSIPEGRVEISWTARGNLFRLRWVESGGPTVLQPERRGFGSFLIESALAEAFDGTATIAYAPTGVEFELASAIATAR